MVDEKGNLFISALSYFGCSNESIAALGSNYLTMSYLIQMSHAGFEEITVRVTKDRKFDNFLAFKMPENVPPTVVRILLEMRPTEVRFHGNTMSLVW